MPMKETSISGQALITACSRATSERGSPTCVASASKLGGQAAPACPKRPAISRRVTVAGSMVVPAPLTNVNDFGLLCAGSASTKRSCRYLRRVLSAQAP
jgi:hypothetical protein